MSIPPQSQPKSSIFGNKKSPSSGLNWASKGIHPHVSSSNAPVSRPALSSPSSAKTTGPILPQQKLANSKPPQPTTSTTSVNIPLQKTPSVQASSSSSTLQKPSSSLVPPSPKSNGTSLPPVAKQPVGARPPNAAAPTVNRVPSTTSTTKSSAIATKSPTTASAPPVSHASAYKDINMTIAQPRSPPISKLPPTSLNNSTSSMEPPSPTIVAPPSTPTPISSQPKMAHPPATGPKVVTNSHTSPSVPTAVPKVVTNSQTSPSIPTAVPKVVTNSQTSPSVPKVVTNSRTSPSDQIAAPKVALSAPVVHASLPVAKSPDAAPRLFTKQPLPTALLQIAIPPTTKHKKLKLAPSTTSPPSQKVMPPPQSHHVTLSSVSFTSSEDTLSTPRRQQMEEKTPLIVNTVVEQDENVSSIPSEHEVLIAAEHEIFDSNGSEAVVAESYSDQQHSIAMDTSSSSFALCEQNVEEENNIVDEQQQHNEQNVEEENVVDEQQQYNEQNVDQEEQQLMHPIAVAMQNENIDWQYDIPLANEMNVDVVYEPMALQEDWPQTQDEVPLKKQRKRQTMEDPLTGLQVPVPRKSRAKKTSTEMIDDANGGDVAPVATTTTEVKPPRQRKMMKDPVTGEQVPVPRKPRAKKASVIDVLQDTLPVFSDDVIFAKPANSASVGQYDDDEQGEEDFASSNVASSSFTAPQQQRPSSEAAPVKKVRNRTMIDDPITGEKIPKPRKARAKKASLVVVDDLSLIGTPNNSADLVTKPSKKRAREIPQYDASQDGNGMLLSAGQQLQVVKIPKKTTSKNANVSSSPAKVQGDPNNKKPRNTRKSRLASIVALLPAGLAEVNGEGRIEVTISMIPDDIAKDDEDEEEENARDENGENEAAAEEDNELEEDDEEEDENIGECQNLVEGDAVEVLESITEPVRALIQHKISGVESSSSSAADAAMDEDVVSHPKSVKLAKNEVLIVGSGRRSGTELSLANIVPGRRVSALRANYEAELGSDDDDGDDEEDGEGDEDDGSDEDTPPKDEQVYLLDEIDPDDPTFDIDDDFRAALKVAIPVYVKFLDEDERRQSKKMSDANNNGDVDDDGGVESQDDESSEQQKTKVKKQRKPRTPKVPSSEPAVPPAKNPLLLFIKGRAIPGLPEAKRGRPSLKYLEEVTDAVLAAGLWQSFLDYAAAIAAATAASSSATNTDIGHQMNIDNQEVETQQQDGDAQHESIQNDADESYMEAPNPSKPAPSSTVSHPSSAVHKLREIPITSMTVLHDSDSDASSDDDDQD